MPPTDASQPTLPINGEWLKSVGIYPNDRQPPEYGVRIVGGTDDGWKRDSGQDADGDEIATLIVVLPEPEDGSAACYVETYQIPSLNTTAVIELGVRLTRGEILDLCRSLKAWAVRYPT